MLKTGVVKQNFELNTELSGAEVGGQVLRMDVGNMQRLTAQVIAHQHAGPAAIP